MDPHKILEKSSKMLQDLKREGYSLSERERILYFAHELSHGELMELLEKGRSRRVAEEL